MTEQTQQAVGEIGPETPAGSTIIMEGVGEAPGDRYTLKGHFDADPEANSPPGFELVAENESDTDLEGMHTYDGWASDYAQFVAEVRFPPAEVAHEGEPATGGASETGPIPPPPNNPVTARLTFLEEAVREARDDFKERNVEYLTLKEQASVAKKAAEEAQEEVNKAVDAWLEDREIGEAGWPKGSPLATQATTVCGTPFEDQSLPADTAWRAVLLRDLSDPSIKPGVLKALLENDPPIVMLGDLADWQAAKGDFWGKDLKGVGKAAQDQIAEATDAYWARNPR